MKLIAIVLAGLFLLPVNSSIAASPEKTALQSRQRAVKPSARVTVTVQNNQVFNPGAVLPVSLKILSVQNARGLRVQFKGRDGLQVIDGARFVHFDAVRAGEAFVHKLKLSAVSAGHYRLNAVIQLDSANRTVARVVSIPITIGRPAQQARVLKQTVQSAGGIKVLPVELRNR